ncbi:MAG: cation:proton antiporter, partial [Sandaracinobacteroides sp.]
MFEFAAYHVLLATLGTSVVLAYWLPRWVSGREPAASALLIGLGFLAFGFVPGMPAALNPVRSPLLWERASEICVVIGLFGVGLRIDKVRARKLWMPTIRMLVIAMPLTILAVAVLGSLAGGMTIAGALLLGAVLAPTDPVLANDVQVGPPLEGGEHPVRFTLTCEAGLNDGLAFPFVHLAIAIGIAGALDSGLLTEWLWRDVGYRILMGVLAGAGMGWLLAQLLFVYPRANALAKTGAGVVAIAGALAAYGVCELLEGYGFIAAFVAGITLRRAESRHEFHTRLHDFSESIERTLTALLLIALGGALPILLPYLDFAGLLVVLALIFVIRPLAGWVSLLGSTLRLRERLLVAVYGVRGIGSIYYLAYAATRIDLVNKEALWAIIAATVLLSTLVHGLTA